MSQTLAPGVRRGPDGGLQVSSTPFADEGSQADQNSLAAALGQEPAILHRGDDAVPLAFALIPGADRASVDRFFMANPLLEQDVVDIGSRLPIADPQGNPDPVANQDERDFFAANG
jgi:hypothetical protein